MNNARLAVTETENMPRPTSPHPDAERKSASRVNGTPIRTKSPKRYWPGPSTRVFTGEEIGVMKAAEAATATTMAKG